MNLVLKVKKRSQREMAIAFAIFMPFTFGLLVDGLGFPTLVKYTIDIAWILLLFLMACTRITFPNKETKSLFRHTLCFFVVTLIGAVVAFQSPLYYLWGFRNNFRFFVLFFACILYLKRENIDEYLRVFDILFYINFPVSLFQYYVQGYSQDFLGGIFGVHKGCNGSVLIFFLIVIISSVLRYMNNRESFLKCMIKCSMALLISVFAELKIMFVLLIIVISVSALVTKFSFKKVVLFIFVVNAVLIGVSLLESIFSNFEGWFSMEGILDIIGSENGYTGKGDLNRMTCIPIVFNRFLTSGWKRLFGLGLGNCDTSAFEFLNTAFYKRYNFLNYNWFSTAFLLLETGITGLICYVTFIVLVFVKAVRVRKANKQREFECQMAQVFTVVLLVVFAYNSSLRTEAGYMAFFILALPFIRDRKTVSMQKVN